MVQSTHEQIGLLARPQLRLSHVDARAGLIDILHHDAVGLRIAIDRDLAQRRFAWPQQQIARFFQTRNLPANGGGLLCRGPVRWYLTPELGLALIAGAIGSTPWIRALSTRIDAAAPRPALAWSMSALSTASLAALLAASLMQMAARTYNPFIYFRF